MTEFTDGTAKLAVTQSLGVLPGTITAFSGTWNGTCATGIAWRAGVDYEAVNKNIT